MPRAEGGVLTGASQKCDATGVTPEVITDPCHPPKHRAESPEAHIDMNGTPLTLARRAVVYGAVGAVLHLAAIPAPAAAAGGPRSATASDYDTYDDDPGDPAFDFEAPFEEAPVDEPVVEEEPVAEEPIAEEPDTEVAAVGEPAPQPLVAPEAEPEPVVEPALQEAPVVLVELPRTGVATGPAVLTGAVLLALGRLATLLGRRRPAIRAGRP